MLSIDISVLLTIGGLAAAVGFIMQLAKQVWLPSDPDKAWVPFGTVVLAILLAVVAAVSQGALQSGQDILRVVLLGLMAGGAAIGGYEATLDKLKKALTDGI